MDHIIQILQKQISILRSDKFSPKKVKVNLADIKALGAIGNSGLSHLIHLDVLADDPVDLHHQIRIVHILFLLFQFVGDRLNGITLQMLIFRYLAPANVFHKTADFAGIGLECFPGLQIITDSICRFLQCRKAIKAIGFQKTVQLKSMLMQQVLRSLKRLQDSPDQLFFINRRIGSATSLTIGRIICQCFSQSFYNADIVNDQAIALALCYTVGTGNRLHQRMCFQRLIQIEAGQALHIEACQPHSADKDNAERILRILEFLIQFPLHHLLPMRPDIQSPFLKGLDLVLLLADDNAHLCLLHPVNLLGNFLYFLLCRCL